MQTWLSHFLLAVYSRSAYGSGIYGDATSSSLPNTGAAWLLILSIILILAAVGWAVWLWWRQHRRRAAEVTTSGPNQL
jgi:LPXTG-motif cell wall-anchored protein